MKIFLKTQAHLTLAILIYTGFIIGVYYVLFRNEEHPNNFKVLGYTNQLDTIEITVTTYNAVSSQCDKQPNVTASGSIIDEKTIMMNRYCAISRDLKDSLQIKFGDTIEIMNPPYNGKYVVKDVMNKRIKNTIDILLPKGQKHVKYKSQIKL